MRRFLLVLISLSPLVLWNACSEVTQAPEDCLESQYFDESNEVCRSCPALEVPACPDRCGVELLNDENGCLMAVCACDLCDEGTFYDTETTSCTACPDISGDTCPAECQPAGTNLDANGCEEIACACDVVCNPRTMAESGTCEVCPEYSAPSCDDGCSLETGEDDDGCPKATCACEEDGGQEE